MLFLGWAIAGPAVAATQTEIHAPRLAPTTVMEKEMEALRRELNALAQETLRIGGTTDPVKRRELLKTHLIHLREVAAAMRAMEAQMHAALDSGQIASDREASERHTFFLDQVAMTMVLLESALAETPAPGAECR